MMIRMKSWNDIRNNSHLIIILLRPHWKAMPVDASAAVRARRADAAGGAGAWSVEQGAHTHNSHLTEGKSGELNCQHCTAHVVVISR